MARQLRFVYPGAVYHVMARGDGGKKLFLTDSDHLLFLDWLDDTTDSRFLTRASYDPSIGKTHIVCV